ncbi:MAG: histidine--tRNA ligase [Candidatus Hodarchaeales archaeon]
MIKIVKLALLKGTNDRLPEEQVLREQITDQIKNIFQLYGFQPATTPILELWDVLASKYAGGAEILKETYRLTDQGQRELALRYDLSVPLARLVGMNPQLRKPFKRYEIGSCFRDGPIKKGRYREFTQCDADIIGVKSMLADAECLALAHQIFASLGLEVVLEINNRKLLSGILLQAGVPDNLLNTTILSIDKLKKIGLEGVSSELEEKGLDISLIETIFEYFQYEGPFMEILGQLEPKIENDLGKQGIKELRELYEYLVYFGVDQDVKLLYSLARGLEIYTGTVFEAFLKDESLTSSLCGGGRYDQIIGKFLERNETIPAVGISFGLETIFDALRNKVEAKPSLTEVYIIPIKTIKESIELATKLRKAKIKTEIDLMGRKISKNLEYADRQSIPFVLIVGKRDLEAGFVTIRSMKDGKEEKLPFKDVVTITKERVVSSQTV